MLAERVGTSTPGNAPINCEIVHPEENLSPFVFNTKLLELTQSLGIDPNNRSSVDPDGITKDDLLQIFINDLGRPFTRFTTCDEDLFLGEVKNRGRAARRKLESGKLHSQQRRKLLEETSDGELAEYLLIKSVAGIVLRKITRRVQLYGDDIEEILSSANEALAAAIIGYDPKKNFRFSTYAGRCIDNKLAKDAVQTNTPKITPDDIYNYQVLTGFQKQIKKIYGETLGGDEAIIILSSYPDVESAVSGYNHREIRLNHQVITDNIGIFPDIKLIDLKLDLLSVIDDLKLSSRDPIAFWTLVHTYGLLRRGEPMFYSPPETIIENMRNIEELRTRPDIEIIGIINRALRRVHKRIEGSKEGRVILDYFALQTQ